MPDTLNIPRLHVLLTQSSDPLQIATHNTIEATCIEFGIVASGSTIESAMLELRAMTADSIQKTIDTFGYDRVAAIAKESAASSDWAVYYELDFLLSHKNTPAIANRQASYTLKEAA